MKDVLTGESVYAIGNLKYLSEVRQIVGMGDLWGSIRSDGKLEEAEIMGKPAYAINGSVFVVRDTTWDQMQALARFDIGTMEELEEPNFKTITEPGDVRIGTFEEVYKRGCVAFPLGAYKDMKNRPIVVLKG